MARTGRRVDAAPTTGSASPAEQPSQDPATRSPGGPAYPWPPPPAPPGWLAADLGQPVASAPAGRVFTPGWIFYGVTLVIAAIGLCGASLPTWNWMAFLAFFAAAHVAFVWAIAFVVAAGQTRLLMSRAQWGRWAGVPLIAMLFLALVWSNAARDARFDLSKQALESAAAKAQAGQSVGPGWIGLMPVDEVLLAEGGAVVFRTAEGCGLAYTPAGPPTDFMLADGYVDKRLARDWWIWCGYGAFD